MKYYPVNLDVKGKNCLIVGGGAVGARKALTLIECHAVVKVVSDKFDKRFEKINGVELVKKQYDKNDLDGIFLVFGTTNNSEVNKKIATDANEKSILCNIADYPDGSSFILPSIVKRGDLVITVSTSGTSPAFAKKLRNDLESQFGHEYAEFLFLMGQIRKQLLFENHAPEEHKKIFKALIENNLFLLVSQKKEKEIDSLLRKITNKDYTYNALISGEIE